MGLVHEMDAGPIFAQELVPLEGHETKQELTEKLLAIGGQLVLQVLPSVLAHTATPVAQKDADATYTSLIQKSDGAIDLTKPAHQLEREIRAYATWPKSRLELHGHQVIVTKARVAQDSNDGKLVIAADSSHLEILELIAPSGKKMSGEAFLRGYAT